LAPLDEPTLAAKPPEKPVPVKTRQQRLMENAITRIAALPNDAAVRKTYGSLCHSLPVLIRQNGLCQAAAFINEKKTPSDPSKPSSAEKAHQLLWEHMAATLEVEPGKLLDQVRGGDGDGLDRYLRDTRTLMDAWIFHKRFAAAMLGVKGPKEDER
jgi:CRISPR type III-B/RAMP module-associated protein Cmr5